MTGRRWLSLVRVFLLGVLAATPLACMQVATSKTQLEVAAANAMCPTGSEGCPCTGGGGCDPGLYCDAGICASYGDEAEADYDFADDVAPPAAAPPAPVERTVLHYSSPRRERKRGRFKNEAKAKRDYAAEAPADTSATSGGEAAPQMEPAANGEPRDPADEVDHSRQVIYTATLEVSVFERDAAIGLAESLPRRYGGWIESRYDYQITLRIRAEHLFDAIRDLGELGVVVSKTLLAEDVTAEYVDLESRIIILEEMVAQLEALLAKATSVEQALQIRAALDTLRIELEAAKARMRQLSEMIDFSTLTVYFSQRGPGGDLPSSNDPFPWVDTLGVESTGYI